MQTETHDQTLTPNSPALLRKTDLTLARIHSLLADQGIIPNEVQRQMLASHVKAKFALKSSIWFVFKNWDVLKPFNLLSDGRLELTEV